MTLTQVRENQETRLKPYFAELEMNIKEKLTIAEKRREEVASDLLNISTAALSPGVGQGGGECQGGRQEGRARPPEQGQDPGRSTSKV